MNHPLDRLVLRDVNDRELPVFFEHQLDPAANHMAAFTSQNPANREAFRSHWSRILADRRGQHFIEQYSITL